MGLGAKLGEAVQGLLVSTKMEKMGLMTGIFRALY